MVGNKTCSFSISLVIKKSPFLGLGSLNRAANSAAPLGGRPPRVHQGTTRNTRVETHIHYYHPHFKTQTTVHRAVFAGRPALRPCPSLAQQTGPAWGAEAALGGSSATPRGQRSLQPRPVRFPVLGYGPRCPGVTRRGLVGSGSLQTAGRSIRDPDTSHPRPRPATALPAGSPVSQQPQDLRTLPTAAPHGVSPKPSRRDSTYSHARRGPRRTGRGSHRLVGRRTPSPIGCKGKGRVLDGPGRLQARGWAG